MTARDEKRGTFSLRVAACRYAAVLEVEKAGLASQADVERAFADLERAAEAHVCAKSNLRAVSL